MCDSLSHSKLENLKHEHSYIFQNKLPVFIPNRCGDNELLYPGDYKDDWVCDCRPGYIYHPTSSACYSPFRQGPCPRKSYLYLPKGQYIPQCQINTCNLDGIVSFNGGCHELGLSGPCKYPELSYVVAVNQTTMQLQCIASQPLHTNLASRFGEDDDTTSEATVAPRDAEEVDSAVNLCPVGSKRWMNRTCT